MDQSHEPSAEQPLSDRIALLLDHLAIQRAHIAARVPSDWQGFVSQHPSSVASLSLICSGAIDASAVKGVADRLYVMSGDLTPSAEQVSEAMQQLPAATHHELRDANVFLWSDITVDYGTELSNSFIPFVASFGSAIYDAARLHDGDRGEIAGITYAVHGSGEPLLLFPLSLAPSGWTPLLDTLRNHFCTIVLGGPALGLLPALEARAQSRGYQRIQRNLFASIELQAGEQVLEVGCGSGAVCRWLAAETDGQNPITGVDINNYLLEEATALTAQAGLDTTIRYQYGNAHALPFADDHFDVTFATTVMEEVNADAMLAELIRVTKPGGRVGVVVRAMDMLLNINIPVHPDLRARFELRPNFDEGAACASATLYRRFHHAPLTDVIGWPQLAEFTDPAGAIERFLMEPFLAQLNAEEVTEWQHGIAQAVADGSFFIAWPHHCAVGTVPG